MRAGSSGTGGTGCCRRSDMGDLRTRTPSNAMALRKAADFANGVLPFSGSHNGVVFVPVQLEPLLRFNIMAALNVTGAATGACGGERQAPRGLKLRELARFPV